MNWIFNFRVIVKVGPNEVVRGRGQDRIHIHIHIQEDIDRNRDQDHIHILTQEDIDRDRDQDRIHNQETTLDNNEKFLYPISTILFVFAFHIRQLKQTTSKQLN